MHEDKTIENIHSEILDNIPDDYEKRLGYPTHHITKAFAIDEAELWKYANQTFSMLNVENMKDDFLELFVSQRRGIDRKQSTHAKVVLEVFGKGTVNEGDLFATKTNVVFRSLETLQVIDRQSINAECVLDGTVGMVEANTIIIFPSTIQGISSVTNPKASYDGFDKETDESLKQRYREAVRLPLTSANKYHYMKWAKEVTGVGAVKVFPLFYGDNTVRVVIVDSNFDIASNDLISKVQEYIDPNKSGRGEGQAPIGAYCTIETAKPKKIDIKIDVQEVAGYSIDDLKISITKKINEYFKNIIFNNDQVSYARIGSLLFQVDGISDYKNFTLNGGYENITLLSDEVPTLNLLEVV